MKKYFFLIAILSCCTTWGEVAPFNGNFTIGSGDYKLVISGKDKFCITKIIYKDYPIGTSTGFYGSILAPAKSQFVGSGHNEGGEERIISIKLFVDGKIQEVSSGAEFEGTTVKLKKISILDKLKVFVDFTITSDSIRIDKKFEALDDQKVYSFYIFQFCWTNKTKDWMIGRPDGSTLTGIFQSNMTWHLLKERELYWYALFDPDAQKGIVGYFASYYPSQGKYMLWDKTRYHKFYYWANLPKIITKGTKSRQYTMILKGINAKPEKWEDAAKKAAAVLEEQYPLPEIPSDFHFDFETATGDKAFKGKRCLLLKGNGSFKCEKIPLSLAKNSTYKISFAIRKTPDTSSKGSDNFVMIGQYDRKRKLHVMATCAGNIPKDNKWHQVKLSLNTSDKAFDGNIYIYNKKSKGSVWIDELNIQKIK
jgi:hypothetical protein